MKKYIEILNNATAKHCNGREWMEKPFMERIHDSNFAYDKCYVCATNAVSAVMICIDHFDRDTDNLTVTYDFLPEKKLSPLMPNKFWTMPAIKTIPLAVLKNIIAEFPREDEYTDDTKECEECNGSGSVEWVYNSYTAEHDCPVCDGAGELATTPQKTGNKVFAAGNRISIGISTFFPERAQDLLRIAEILDCDIDLIHQDAITKPSLFRIENCLVLLAPCAFEYRDKVLYKL